MVAYCILASIILFSLVALIRNVMELEARVGALEASQKAKESKPRIMT